MKLPCLSISDYILMMRKFIRHYPVSKKINKKSIPNTHIVSSVGESIAHMNPGCENQTKLYFFLIKLPSMSAFLADIQSEQEVMLLTSLFFLMSQEHFIDNHIQQLT